MFDMLTPLLNHLKMFLAMITFLCSTCRIQCYYTAAKQWYNPELSEYFFWTKNECEYIWNILFNTNMNIFGITFWTEFEYEYICNNQVTKYEYSNILGLNIQLLFDEYSNIPWNAGIGIKFCIPKIQPGQLSVTLIVIILSWPGCCRCPVQIGVKSERQKMALTLRKMLVS